jgi:hypothetical protein
MADQLRERSSEPSTSTSRSAVRFIPLFTQTPLRPFTWDHVSLRAEPATKDAIRRPRETSETVQLRQVELHHIGVALCLIAFGAFCGGVGGDLVALAAMAFLVRSCFRWAVSTNKIAGDTNAIASGSQQSVPQFLRTVIHILTQPFGPFSFSHQSAPLPGWYHAAGRAPAAALGLICAITLILGFGASGGIATLLIALAVSPYAIRAICRWGFAPATPPQPIQAIQQQQMTTAESFNPATWSPVWRLLRAYLRAVFAYVTTLYILSSISQGITPMGSFWFQLNLLVPLTYMALIVLPLARDVILFMIRTAQRLGLRRGTADCAIGAMFGCAVGIIHLIGPISSREMPSVQDLLMFAFQIIAGALAGFEFWRGVGSPGVARGTATLLGRFKNGLVRGLRYKL